MRRRDGSIRQTPESAILNTMGKAVSIGHSVQLLPLALPLTALYTQVTDAMHDLLFSLPKKAVFSNTKIQYANTLFSDRQAKKEKNKNGREEEKRKERGREKDK